MITTGYMFISNGWMDYVKHHKRYAREDPVFLLADDNGKFDDHALGGRVTTPLFKHGSAKQWHGYDAKVFLFAEKHYVLVIVGLLFMVLAWFTCLCCAICGRCTPKRRRERKAMRAERRANATAARDKRARDMKATDDRQRKAQHSPSAPVRFANPSNTTPAHDMMSRLLNSMAPAPPAANAPNSLGRTARARSVVGGSNESVSPIASPVRSASYTGSYTGRRTSSMMIPPKGRAQTSIYDFAY
jgi:hypothetical protein